MSRSGRRRFERASWAFGVLLTPWPLQAATYYVSPTGSDTAAGTTQDAPWATMTHAQQVAVAGDTVLFLTGTYTFTRGLTACGSATATINAVLLNKSGTANNRINYWAAPGATPVFDFAGVSDSCRITGIRVTGSWIHLKGIEVMGVPQNNTANHESWGVWNSGSNNVFEQLNLHDNMGPGLFIQDGSNNLVLNCDSYKNFDANSSTGPGTNADGFGCHVSGTGTGNVFRGCRAWFNGDDGYDFINAAAPILLESSWAFNNGYRAGTTTASGGDGNGFKGGGYGSPAMNVPNDPPQHTIRNCVSFLNRAAGFYANHHPVPNFWYNDTAFNNRGGNFNMLGLVGTTAVNVGVLRNNIAFTGTAITNGTGAMIDDSFNSWDTALGVTVTAADFQSTVTTGWDAPRQADGSLPVLTSLHLAAGSDLIDKGTNIQLPFGGTAPDLGAFETGVVMGGAGGSVGAGGAIGAGGAAPDAGAGIGTGGRRVDAGATGMGGAGGAGTGGASVGTGGASTGAGGAGAGGAGTGGAGQSGGRPDGSAGTGGTEMAGDGGVNGGCSCRVSDRGDGRSALALLSLLGLVIGRRRRARR